MGMCSSNGLSPKRDLKSPNPISMGEEPYLLLVQNT